MVIFFFTNDSDGRSSQGGWVHWIGTICIAYTQLGAIHLPQPPVVYAAQNPALDTLFYLSKCIFYSDYLGLSLEKKFNKKPNAPGLSSEHEIVSGTKYNNIIYFVNMDNAVAVVVNWRNIKNNSAHWLNGTKALTHRRPSLIAHYIILL